MPAALANDCSEPWFDLEASLDAGMCFAREHAHGLWLQLREIKNRRGLRAALARLKAEG